MTTIAVDHLPVEFLRCRRRATKAEEACPLHLDRSQLSNTFIFRVTLNPSVARIDLIPEGGPLPNYNNGKGSHGRILS